jgi:hypothetical protein
MFNKIYKKQNGRCNVTGRYLNIEEASFHHKYIPQCIFRCNKEWNVEILSPDEHKKKHKNKLAIVNILIKIVKIKKIIAKFIHFQGIKR